MCLHRCCFDVCKPSVNAKPWNIFLLFFILFICLWWWDTDQKLVVFDLLKIYTYVNYALINNYRAIVFGQKVGWTSLLLLCCWTVVIMRTLSSLSLCDSRMRSHANHVPNYTFITTDQRIALVSSVCVYVLPTSFPTICSCIGVPCIVYVTTQWRLQREP